MSKSKKFLFEVKKHKYLIIILGISLLVFYRWISFSVFAYSDWYFFFSENIKELLTPSVWVNSCNNFGSIDITLWKTPVYLIQGIFGTFGSNSNIPEKFLVFWPMIIFSGIFSFLLIKKIIVSKIGSVIGSFIFCYNTYFLSINSQGHEYLTIAFIFVVLAFWFFIKTLEEKKIFLAVCTSILLFIIGSYDLRALYIAFALIFFYFLFFLFFLNKLSSFKKEIKAGLYVAISVLVFLLLSMYWLLPYFKSGVITNNPILNRELFGNNYWNIMQSITLFFPFWNGRSPEWFVVQPIPIYFWLIPIFAFLGLIFNKNKKVIFFGFISIVGILLTKQVGEPFSHLYEWLYKNFPGFNMFREASKFYFLIILGYSVLIGSFIAFICKYFNKNRLLIVLKYCLIILIIFISLWNTVPVITGEIDSLYISRQIPEDYLVLKDFILEQPEYFRTFWTPTVSRWGFDSNNHPYISNAGIVQSNWVGFANPDIYEKPFTHQLFNIASIKYIIVPIRDTKSDDDFFVYYGNDREYFINKLDKIEYLKRVDIGQEELVIYENKNFKPHIYVTSEEETVNKDIQFEHIDFNSINQSIHTINFTNIKEKLYLNFSETYDLNWKLMLGKFNLSSVIGKNYLFLPDPNHYKNDASLNSFLIDPEYIKLNYPKELYTENIDGSIDIEMTLVFKSQIYLYLGLAISAFIFFLLMVYLIFYFFRNRRKK